jgi:uncharacterized protein
VNKQVIAYSDYENLISNICREIHHSGWTPDLVVGLTRGGLIPAVFLSHWLDVKMNSLDISLRDGGDCVSNLGLANDAFDGKNILVVDDINDTGSTFNWLINDWMDSAHPSSEIWEKVWNGNVKFAVVVDNLSSKSKVSMDFVGMEINKADQDVWIEFPYENWWKK